jgi:hypothetical protein
MASRDYSAAFDRSIDKHILTSFEGWESNIPDICHVETTNRRFVTHQGWQGYGLPTPRFPGELITEGEVHQSYDKQFNMRSAGLGDSLPIEDVDDDPTGMLTQGSAMIAGGLSQSFKDYCEIDLASFLINGFTSTAGTPDSASLYSLTHPRSRNNPGVTDANRPTTGVDMSVATVQQMISRLRLQKAPNGRPMHNTPRVCWYNPTLDFTARQIFKQAMEPYTANNNDNIIKGKYGDIKLVEMPYLLESGVDADAWGMIADMHFLYFIWRTKFRTHNDFDARTKSYLVMGDIRYDLGHSDWRGTDASPGA